MIKFYKLFLTPMLLTASIFYHCSAYSIKGPRKVRLSQINYSGASVLPIVTSRSGAKMVLLGREAFGRKDKGTYDAFGGKKDRGETHPLITASREFAEETAYNVFSRNKTAKDYINGKATKSIIVNSRKHTVYYLTNFSYDKLNVKNFYNKRARANSIKQKEKDRLAWVRLNDLKKAIANAPRNRNGLLITPIRVKANIVNPNGTETKNQTIALRPVFVSSLQSYFKNKPVDQKAVDPRVNIYNS